MRYLYWLPYAYVSLFTTMCSYFQLTHTAMLVHNVYHSLRLMCSTKPSSTPKVSKVSVFPADLALLRHIVFFTSSEKRVHTDASPHS